MLTRRREHLVREAAVQVERDARATSASRSAGRRPSRVRSRRGAATACRSSRCRPRSARRRVERLERDPPVRRELAARDVEHPARAPREDGLAPRAHALARRRPAGRAARRTSARTRSGATRLGRSATAASRGSASRRPARRTAPSGSPSYVVSVVPRSEHPVPGHGEGDADVVLGDGQRGVPLLVRADERRERPCSAAPTCPQSDPRAGGRGRPTARRR